MNLAAEFRQLAEEPNASRDRRGRRYSKEARQVATRYCREQRRTGRALAKIARELGVTGVTLGRWLEAAPKRDDGVPFREVAVVEEVRKPETSSIRVTLANGLRIEGLMRDDLIELVKALA